MIPSREPPANPWLSLSVAFAISSRASPRSSRSEFEAARETLASAIEAGRVLGTRFFPTARVHYGAIRSLAGDDVGLLGIEITGTFRVSF